MSVVNVDAYEYLFSLHEHIHGLGLVRQLAGVAVAAAGSDQLPASVAALCEGVSPTAEQKKVAASLSEAENGLVLTGLIAGRHKAAAAVRALATAIGDLTGSRSGTLSEASNTAGGHLVGVLPHRGKGGQARSEPGLDAASMLEKGLDTTLLFGLEPDDLTCVVDSAASLASHRFVAAFTPYVSEGLEQSVNLMLPIGTFAETSGTFVNCEGRWQSFPGISNPVGEARPGWKVLRVLGNLLDADGFEYVSSEEILDELKLALGDRHPEAAERGAGSVASVNGADDPGDEIDVPIYAIDPLVRRASALQLTPEARRTGGDAS